MCPSSEEKKKGIKHVCVSVSRDNGGGPLPLAFPPTGCTTDSGLSSVLNNAPPSAREQGSGDNPGTDRGMVFVGSGSGVKNIRKRCSKSYCVEHLRCDAG